MALSILCFSANSLVVKAAGSMPGVNGWTATALRGAVGILIVMAFYWPRRQFQPAHLVTNPLLFLRGILGTIGTVIFYISLFHLGAGRAVLIACTYTVFGTLFAAVFLKEKLRPAQLAWMGLSMLGLTIITGVWQGGGRLSFYDVLAVVGALAAGAVVVTIRRLHRTESTGTIYSAQCFYGLLFVAPPVALDAPAFSGLAFAILVAASVLVSLGQLTMTRAYRDMPVAQGSSMQLTMPVVTAVGSALFFGEVFSYADVLGAAMILFGCLQMVRLKYARPDPVADELRANANEPLPQPSGRARR